MNALRIASSLSKIDTLNMRRDPLLRWMVVLPLMTALVIRFVFPLIISRLEATLQIGLGESYPAIAGYALLITAPVMCGMVIGFLMLDERDDRTLLALRVTPLPLGAYLAWRLAGPMLLSIIITTIAFPLAGLNNPETLQLSFCTLLTAPIAPMVALLLATIAQNKVQGFALVKAWSVFQMAPMIAYFVDSGWQLLLGVIPTYWPAKLLWTFQQGDSTAWLYLIAGLAYQLLLLGALLRRFNRSISL